MARRSRRFHRQAPDRGWIVGHNSHAYVVGDPGGTTVVSTLFDFADIDPDSLGMVEADKSDWFVKRVILDVASAVAFDGTTPTDTARLYECAMGTIANENADDLQNNNYAVFSAEATNLFARLFQAWVQPVYGAALIPYADNPFPIAIDAATPQVVSSYGVTSTPWGPSKWHADFDVSNAGLRNNQSCIFTTHMNRGPASFDWDNLDTLYLEVYYKILMQKRRS